MSMSEHMSAEGSAAQLSMMTICPHCLDPNILLCGHRHILFQVAAGLKALPPPGPGRPEDTSQMGSDTASAATQLDKVCTTQSHPLHLATKHAILSLFTHQQCWYIKGTYCM